MISICTENQDQESFCPSAPWEVSGLPELAGKKSIFAFKHPKTVPRFILFSLHELVFSQLKTKFAYVGSIYTKGRKNPLLDCDS